MPKGYWHESVILPGVRCLFFINVQMISTLSSFLRHFLHLLIWSLWLNLPSKQYWRSSSSPFYKTGNNQNQSEPNNNLPGPNQNPQRNYQESNRIAWFWLIPGGLLLGSHWVLMVSGRFTFKPFWCLRYTPC